MTSEAVLDEPQDCIGADRAAVDAVWLSPWAKQEHRQSRTVSAAAGRRAVARVGSAGRRLTHVRWPLLPTDDRAGDPLGVVVEDRGRDLVVEAVRVVVGGEHRGWAPERRAFDRVDRVHDELL